MTDAGLEQLEGLANLMDLRLDARIIAWRNDTRTIKAGIDASIWIPTGNGFSYGGDGGTHGADRRWATAVSMVTTRSRLAIRPAVSAKSSRSAPAS